MRAMLSVFPPAANGTIMTTDRCGHSAEWDGMAKLKLIKAIKRIKKALEASITAFLYCDIASN
jgi:hypothetical protein